MSAKVLPALPRLRPLARGALSFVAPRFRTHNRANPLGTVSAESCYSIFFRHLCLMRQAGLRDVPRVVAELGPGSSLGTGFAALLAGAETYYALDIVNFTDRARNLAVFDRLVELFRRRAPIPAKGLHSRFFPDLDSYAFPDFLAVRLAETLDEKAAAIRRDIADGSGQFVRLAAPWTDQTILATGSLDWVFSHSVLEHIDDLPAAYRALARWLKPGGYMSHQIDFGSHGLTREWNAHWALNDVAWFVLRGRRPYLVNRLAYAEHVQLATEAGFVTVLEKHNKNFDGLTVDEFAGPFRGISDEDARTKLVFCISRRR